MALNLKAPKQITKLWKSYIESLKSGGHKSTKMEALRPFMGARGGILKRNTRSAKQKEAFNAAAQEVQKQYGRKTSQRAFTEKQEKQRATRATNAAKEYQKKQKKKQTGKALTRGAKKYVEEQQRKYDEMLDILTSGSQKLLSSKVRYEIYKAMDAENISAEDIQAFIDKLLATLGDIPEEAAELAKQDSFVDALIKLTHASNAEMSDFSAMFTAITMVDADQQDDVMHAVQYWQEPENNPSGMSFGQFWNELQNYNDLGSKDNYAEILGSEEE